MAYTKKAAYQVAIGALVVLGCWVVSPSDAEAVCTPLGSLTPTIGLCLPASGEVSWSTAINGNFSLIDNQFAGGATAAGTGNCNAGGFVGILNTLSPPTCVFGINGQITFAGGLSSTNFGNPLSNASCIIGENTICSKQANSYDGLYIERGTNVSPSGTLINAYDATHTTQLFVVDINGVIQTSSVGLNALRTAPGSSNCTMPCGINASANYFNLSFVTSLGAAEPLSTCLGATQTQCWYINHAGGTFFMQWTNFTNSNHPQIWVAYQPDGTIVGTWAADDPAPSNPLQCDASLNCSFKSYLPIDLEVFNFTTDELTVGMHFDDSWGYDYSSLYYRALQVRAGDVKEPDRHDGKLGAFKAMPAPTTWLLSNAVVNPSTGHLCPKSNSGC